MTSGLAKFVAGLVAAVLLVATGAFLATRVLPGAALFGADAEAENTQVVDAITREEQVVLLSLGIQGIAERTERGTFLGMDVPGSGRASFVQYSFNAKLGIEGEDVSIRETGEGEYLVSIPEFVFIGHDDETFETVVEDNGALSFVTPEIDTVEMINSILDDDAQDGYVDANEEVLRDQARLFYSAIVASIDPSITLTFEFR